VEVVIKKFVIMEITHNRGAEFLEQIDTIAKFWTLFQIAGHPVHIFTEFKYLRLSLTQDLEKYAMVKS
jgi:hypothetical protein